MSSEICRGCTFPDPAQEPLRPFDQGHDLDASPYVGGVFEVMTPELAVPLSPRLFIGAEFGGGFGTQRKVAREGDVGAIVTPVPGIIPTSFPEETALGQGSETIAELGDYYYGAQVGVAIPFEAFQRALRIRASFAWIHYDIDLEGVVSDAECLEFFGVTECETALGGFLRPTVLSGNTTEQYDGIGPGLDIEMDAGRFGPIGASLLLGGRIYSVLGDRSVEFSSDAVTVSDMLGTDQNRAQFTFEADQWLYRVGVGIRFQWLGDEE